MHPSDTTLVTKAQEGDQDAFAALVERYQGKVYNLALRLTGSAEDAADLSQEAFLKAWRGLPSFQWDSSFYTWLYKLTHNACLDFLRKRTRQQGAESPLSLDEEENGLAALTPDPAPSPQRQLEGKELKGAIAAGLERLSPEHREALSLRLAGLSYTEIAQTLGVEEGTVKSRIARARLNLRDYLRKSGNLPGLSSSKGAEHSRRR